MANIIINTKDRADPRVVELESPGISEGTVSRTIAKHGTVSTILNLPRKEFVEAIEELFNSTLTPRGVPARLDS